MYKYYNPTYQLDVNGSARLTTATFTNGLTCWETGTLNNLSVSNTITASSNSGNSTTQTIFDNSTKLATTQYIQNQINASCLIK